MAKPHTFDDGLHLEDSLQGEMTGTDRLHLVLHGDPGLLIVKGSRVMCHEVGVVRVVPAISLQEVKTPEQHGA